MNRYANLSRDTILNDLVPRTRIMLNNLIYEPSTIWLDPHGKARTVDIHNRVTGRRYTGRIFGVTYDEDTNRYRLLVVETGTGPLARPGEIRNIDAYYLSNRGSRKSHNIARAIADASEIGF